MKKTPVMSMKWVWIFLIVFGLVFFIIGVGVYVGISASGPDEIGDALIFLCTFGGTGLLIMIIGVVVARNLGKGGRFKKQLMEKGHYIMADVFEASWATNISINGRSPYVLRCRYTDSSGQTYIYKSEYLSYDPSVFFPEGKVKIWYDPDDIKKYYVDVESTLDGRVIEL